MKSAPAHPVRPLFLRPQSFLRHTMLFALLGALALYTVFYLSAPGQIAYAAGNVTGTVFRDYNANNVRDTRDTGIGGVVVKAFNSAGAVAATATTVPQCVGNNLPAGSGCTGINTPAAGTYSLGSLANGQYRIEFTTTNTALKPGAGSAGNGTTVQFVDVTAGNVSTLNVGFNNPADYCQNNPDLITPCYYAGAQTTTVGTLFSHDYTDNSPTASPASQTTEAQSNQIGTTYGLAYRRTTNVLYAGAYLKRAAGFGPGGPGAIYAITPGGAADGTTFVTVPNVIVGGEDADLHTDFSPSNNNGDFDSYAFSRVGKRSLGDLDISEDDTTLYVVNLNDRHLYSVDLTAGVPAATDRGLIPNPTPACTNGTARPFGLGVRDGKVYIGGVCDASTGAAADMTAYVLQATPAAGTFVTSATTVMSFGLNFGRQCLNVGVDTNPQLPTCRPTIDRPFANWHPWTDTFSTIVQIDGAGNNDTYNISGGNGGYPMPMLSDIVFDGEDMILGFRDRNGDMIGYADPGPTESHGGAGEPPLLNTTGGGDILRAGPNGTGGWTIENNSSSNPAGIFGPTTGAAKPQGPGGGEFYFGDDHTNHDETMQGGLAQVPGAREVASTVADPGDGDILAGGTSQLSNVESHPGLDGTGNDGERYRRVELYDLDDGGTDANRFSKANGLGDLEALCNAAPLEIGNRVWRDTDGDGVQDPDEMPLSGITVQLVRSGTVVGTAVTNSKGEYYFVSSTVADPNTSDNVGQVNETAVAGQQGIARATGYVVRINPTVSTAQSNLLNGLALTTANAADAGSGDAGANADARDSDATVNGSNYEVSFTTGGAGDNNHSFDFGFAPLGSIGNRVWVDEDSNGYQDEGEDGIANVIVELKNSGGTVLATTRTDSQGYYLFPNLPAGSYFVEVQSGIPSGMTQTNIYPNAGADLFNQDQTTNANGYGVTISAGQDNLTADFGYNWNPTSNVNNGGGTNTTAALGDRVWIDTNGNGRQDAGEVGVSGVTVTLTGPGPDGLFSTTGDNTTATTTTDANGYYIFDNLTPGAYTVSVTSASGASHAILTGGQYNQTGDPDHWGTTGTNNDNTTTTPVVLGPGDVFLDADFGYQPSGASLGSVGNFVWFDRDADGVGPTVNGEAHGAAPGTDNTEEGIGGVSVALIRDLNDNGVWDANEPIIATMFTSDGTQDVDGDGSTDPKGFYRFRSLSITDGAGAGADDYLVWVNDTDCQLDGLRATYDLDGSGTPASGLVTGFGISRVDDLGGAVTTHDFGYTPDNSGQQASRTTLSTSETGVIGNYVWFDIDGDGNGPSGNGDGSTNPETGEVGIGGVRVFLYQDSNQNGALDAGEPLLAVTYTSPEGYYLFTNLVTTDGTGTDDYIVRVDTSTLPGGLGQTYDATSPTTDSTSVVADLTSTPVLTQDFGYRGANVAGNAFGSIGNLVWNDVNADGNVDAGENGFAGVTVDLYFDTNGNGKLDAGEPLIETQTTSNGSQDVDNDGSNDTLGFYRFRNLPTDDGSGSNAQYIVDVSDRAGVLSGYFHSLGNQSQGSDNESKTDPFAVTLTNAAPNVVTADFGYYVLPAALGNFVWNDTDGDGIQDAGEVGINGVVVQLVITYPGANGVIGGGDDTVTTLRTTTGDNPNQTGTQTGWYSFDNLLQDEDYNGVNTVGTGEPTFVISVVTADDTGALAGLVKTNVDQGGSDLLDSDNHAGVTATTTEGQRTVTQEALGSSENTISSYDFGYTAPVNIGNRIWYDTDNDGVYEPNGNDSNGGTTADNEVGINNVAVRLYRDTNGNGTFESATDTLVASTTTDSSGLYNFTLLTPSLAAINSTKYLVVLPDTNFLAGGALVGYQNSTLTDAANSDVDSRDHGLVSGTLGSANGVVTTNGSVVVTAGGEPAAGVDTDSTSGNLTIDFGFYKLLLTGTVFNDVNNNGALDAGENTVAIVNNVTVRLYRDTNSNGSYDAGDTLAGTTTTNATGDYSFTNLTAGKYIVNVVLPANYHSTIDTANQTDNNTPNTGANNNDNGTGTGYNNAYSRAFDLNPNDTTTNLGNTITFSSGTTSNDRQDFGLSQSPTSAELGTLKADANDDSSVTVTWETLSETSSLGFNIQRSGTRDGDFVNVNADLIPALSVGLNTGNNYAYTDLTTQPDNTYFYRIQLVRADTSTLEGDAVRVKVKAGSNACSGKTDAPVLTAPENEIKLKAGKIEFAWNAVPCAVRYQIELRADTTDGAVIADKSVKDTNFSIKKLDQGTTYYWRVSSCNAKGKCVAGQWWSFKIKKDQDKK